VHKGFGAERRIPAVAVAAAAQEQEGTEVMDIAIAVACKGGPKLCENEGFSDKPTRSCSLVTRVQWTCPKGIPCSSEVVTF
jgi:hypothetical protein